MPIKIEDQVYLKIASHAAKHSYQDVYGLILVEDGAAKDVVPLSHLSLNSCFLHSAFDVISRTLRKYPSLKIGGFYDFEESFPNEEPNFHLQKTILASICGMSKAKNAFYIRISANKTSQTAENLQEMTIPEALAEFEKNDYRLNFDFYNFESNLLSKMNANDIQGAFSLQKFEQISRDGLHLSIIDMDDHFDDPANDFMNPNFVA